MLPEMLIAYVTRSGSTAEVAEALGVGLREAGLAVAVQPMTEVESIPVGDCVILGAALYVGHLPKEFHRFVVRYRDALAKLRPWIFILGPTENDPKHFESAGQQAEKELAKYPWLRPAEVRILGGKFDPRTLTLPFPMSLIMHLPANPMRKLPASDIRDWEGIRSWAKSIADSLKTAA
jgi:menaquinone-dependent protoporphyrinogen oxidase